MKIWISPCPGVAMPGFLLWQQFCFSRYLYRDIDGKCRKTTFIFPTDEVVFAR
jgi:hypothetical protein